VRVRVYLFIADSSQQVDGLDLQTRNLSRKMLSSEKMTVTGEIRLT
jgi:hypothetical protein